MEPILFTQTPEQIAYKEYKQKGTFYHTVINSLTVWLKENLPEKVTFDIFNQYYTDANMIGMYFLITQQPFTTIIVFPRGFRTDVLIEQELIRQVKNKLFIQCNYCETFYPNQNTLLTILRDRRIICAPCAAEALVACVTCNGFFLQNDLNIDFRSINGIYAWYCLTCTNRAKRHLPDRGYKNTVIGKGFGEIIQSARGWSTEIECYLTDTENGIEELAKLPTSLGIGRDASLANVGYKMKDGRQYTVAVEFTTPVLKGVEGEKYVQNLCKAINKEDNAQVDLSCGLHIHIDMSDCNKDFEVLRRILIFHWMYEPVIMSFLPSSRRSNRYAKSLKNDYAYEKIKEAQTINDLINIWYKEGRADRNFARRHGINFHCLFEDGHLEIRYHSGTTNARKILHWANLHTRIIDYCIGKISTAPDVDTLISEGLTQIGRARSLTRLTTQLFTMLQLHESSLSYFKVRQKKFINAPHCEEVEFIEKDIPNPTKQQQLQNKENYTELITNITQARVDTVELEEDMFADTDFTFAIED